MRENLQNLMETSLTQSARDFLTSGLSEKGRTRQSSCRSSIIDLVDECLVERNIDPHGPTGIGKQRNSEQHSTCFDGCFHVFVPQDQIHGTCCRQSSPRAFKRFRMLTKSSRRIRNCFFQGFACREASFHIRKPDAESAVSFFFNDRYVIHRHCLETSSYLRSRTPASQLVNAPYQSDRQIPPGMRHGDDYVPLRMLVRVVIAIDPIKHPSILLQHPDQLAAVSFHPTFEAAPRIDLGRRCFPLSTARPNTHTRSVVCMKVDNRQ